MRYPAANIVHLGNQNPYAGDIGKVGRKNRRIGHYTSVPGVEMLQDYSTVYSTSVYVLNEAGVQRSTPLARRVGHERRIVTAERTNAHLKLDTNTP